MSASTSEAVRAQVHGMWSAVADRWADHADEIDERGADITAAMLTSAGVRRGDEVLELACGPGGLGMAAAELVGAEGAVVLSDVAGEMVAIAAERAARRGLTNVRTATLDLEEIAEPENSFDVVLCREGLMFAVEPDQAIHEIPRAASRRSCCRRGVGAAARQPMARSGVRRSHGNDWHPSPAAGNSRPVRAR